jgi:hypothetical protein
VLHLNGSSIEISHVLRLLRACPIIATLNLLDCKKLPRSLSGKAHGKVSWRMYEGKELATLKSETEKIRNRFKLSLPNLTKTLD